MYCDKCKIEKSFFDLHKVRVSDIHSFAKHEIFAAIRFKKTYPTKQDEPVRYVCTDCLSM